MLPETFVKTDPDDRPIEESCWILVGLRPSDAETERHRPIGVAVGGHDEADARSALCPDEANETPRCDEGSRGQMPPSRDTLSVIP